MRARRREINIFNMSLLDILCGALGAFCFMMIVALPYYIPPGSGLELRKAQQETERLLLAIGNLKDRMPDQKSVEEMEKLMRELEAQVKALQGRVNILTSENEGLRGQVNQLTAEKDHLRTQVNQLTAEKQQLQTQVDQLMTEKQQLVARNQELETKNKELIAANEELTNRLNRRRPFLLVARTADSSQDVDVMVKYKTTSEESGPVPDKMFAAWLNGEFDVINQIRAAYLSGRGIALNMVTEVAGGATLKAYVRLATVSTRRAATEINSALFGNTAGMPPTRLPKVTLTPERFWIFLGTIRLNDNYEPVFQEATAEERDAEWKALTSSTPPPTPTPTPTPSDAERAAAEAQRAKFEANRLKIQEARKKFTKLMQIPFDDTGKNDAEILQLTDEILKDLPPRDFMYREVQSRRNHMLEMKARREGGTPPPTNRVSPPSPPPQQPAPEPGKEPPPLPKTEETAVPAPKRTATAITLRSIAIGSGVLALLVVVVVLSRCGGKNKTAAVEHERAKPQPTASVTPAPTAAPTTTVPPPQPTVAPPTPSIAAPFSSPAFQFPPSGLTTDLAALIANAAPGATIKIPPGVYPGGLVVPKAVRLVGTSGQVWIQSEGRECLSVRAPGVFVQNVQFTCNGIGELPAISVADGADLELEGCKVQSNSAVGVTITGNASLKALGSNFTAANGLAVRLTQGARANITQSSFNDSQLGLWLAQGATAELHSCAFERTGGQEAKGAIISLRNPKTTLTADDCHFTGNTGGINAITSATLTLTNCSFKNDGITPRGGSALGLVALFDNSTATLKGTTFEGNQQGVAVSEGSKLEMEKCQFSGSGVQGRNVIPSCQPIAVFGKGATAVIRNTGIFDSAQYAAVAMGGGKIQMEEVDISGTSSAGLVVGDRAAGAGEGEIKHCRFRNNGTGIGIFGASSATVEDCEFKENKDGIIVLDKDSQLNGTKLKFIANRDGGLFVHALGQATVADSDFQNNTRGAIAGVKGKSAERGAITLNDCRFSGSRTFAAGACAQSELTLTRCVFDGSDKTNIYKERGAIVQTDVIAGASASPSAGAESTATPEASATAQAHRKPTPRPKHRRPEDDVSRMIRRLLPPP